MSAKEFLLPQMIIREELQRKLYASIRFIHTTNFIQQHQILQDSKYLSTIHAVQATADQITAAVYHTTIRLERDKSRIHHFK